MSEKERPLPKPPKTPFGRRRHGENEEEPQQPLMADQLAMAAAEGRLEEYMQKHLPDNEQARKLAMMMLGMTGMGGMMPQTEVPAPEKESASEVPADDRPGQGHQESRETQVPEEVMQAVHSGDMYQLMELLRREHQKRTGSEIPPSPPPANAPGFNTAPAGIEKEVLDQLLEIASANSVTLDWLILRAMKVYIEDYRKTGKL